MSKVVDYFFSKREDMLLFAASLAISFALFAQLQSSFVPDKEREIEVQLSFANQSDDMTILQAPQRAKVLASGSQQLLDSIDTSKIRAVVDLEGAVAGVDRYRIEVTGPARRGLTLTPVVGNAEIRLEAKSRKEFEVKLSPTGAPPQAFAFIGATVFPPVVTVSGPESMVPQVLSVRAVLDLSNVSPNQTVFVELEALGEGNRPVPLVSIDPPRVEVSPALSIGLSNRKLLVAALFVGQPAFGYTVTGYTITPNQIEATGDSASVSRVTTIDTRPIDLNGLTSTRTFRVKLDLPEGIKSASGDDVVVVVRVARR